MTFIRSNVTAPTDLRRSFIHLALKRAHPGSGSTIAFLNQRTANIKIIDLRNILEDIRWVLVGGIATRAYMPERMTLDVDVLIHAEESESVTTILNRKGFSLIQRSLNPGSSWKAPDGTIIGILERSDNWIRDALEIPSTDPQGLPVLSLPYLVLMRLESSRTQDLADIARMLGGASEEAIDAVHNVIAQYLPDAISDLEGLIQLGKLEYDRRG